MTSPSFYITGVLFVPDWELRVVEYPVYYPFYHEILQVNVDGRYDLTNPDRPILSEEVESVTPLKRSERIDLLINR